jgi:hypothetical protein
VSRASARGECAWRVRVASARGECAWQVRVASARGECAWRVRVARARGEYAGPVRGASAVSIMRATHSVLSITSELHVSSRILKEKLIKKNTNFRF